MKRREVNLGRTDENIAEQYDNLCEGLQKDAGQNSWDAKATAKGKDWKLAFTYNPKHNCLIIEDFGTLGMNAKRWKEYQSLWDTTKAEEAKLGARGQGKFLFHYFATNKLVLTESIDEEGTYRSSFGTSEEYDDENCKLEDFIPKAHTLDHQGTRICIMDIKKELLEELLDKKTFMNYIAATWWEIIRNWDAIFTLDFDGISHKVVIPQLPPIKKKKTFCTEKIENLGKVKNLELYYCEDEVPELWRGIAVQRGGMTILRIPVAAEESIKNRIYGYCNFDKDLELELKKVEFPNHFGFSTKRAWNHTREYMRKKLEEFIQEISPAKKRKEVTVPQDLIEQAVRIVNDLVREYAPELASEAVGPKGKKPEKGEPTPPKPPPPPIRIDTFRGNERKLEYDESLITDCELINDTTDKVEIRLRIEITYEEGDLKFNPKYTINLDGNAKKKVDIPLVDFEEGVDKPGEYKATAILENTNGQELHKRSFTFYLHEEPPPPKGKVFLSAMVFTYGKGTILEKKRHLPLTDKGVLRIIYDHPDFNHVRDQASSKKIWKHEVLLYAIKCGVDEAVQKLLEFRYNEGRLDIDQIKAIQEKRDAMYYDAVLSPIT